VVSIILKSKDGSSVTYRGELSISSLILSSTCLHSRSSLKVYQHVRKLCTQAADETADPELEGTHEEEVHDHPQSCIEGHVVTHVDWI
jgi:hypothetical protein